MQAIVHIFRLWTTNLHALLCLTHLYEVSATLNSFGDSYDVYWTSLNF